MLVAPGLFWAIGFAFGIFIFFYPLSSSLLFLLFSIFLFWLKAPWKTLCLWALFGLCLTALSLKLPQNSEIQGKAFFTPSRVEKRTFFGRPNYIYSGTLNHLNEAKNLPTTLRLKKPLPCKGTWEFEGTLKQIENRFFLSFAKLDGGSKNKVPNITIQKEKGPLSALLNNLGLKSLAQKRYEFQKKAAQFLERHLRKTSRFFPTLLSPSKSASQFLSALFLGIKPSDSMRFEFSRAGLSHLLVVSGFHFALVAALFGYALSAFFSPRTASSIQIAILLAYFLMLGSSPSVQRAFLVCFFYYFGIVINRPSRPEHALSLAALFELSLSPLSALNIGFQLSYLITAAILLFFQPISTFIKGIWKVGNSKFSSLEKGLRELFSLNITVTLAALPLTLFHFYTFPLASLLYNLFIPPLTALTMTLALPCLLLLSPFPTLLEQALVPISLLIQFILGLVEHFPMRLGYEIIWVEMPGWVCASLLLILFGYILRSKTIDQELIFR